MENYSKALEYAEHAYKLYVENNQNLNSFPLPLWLLSKLYAYNNNLERMEEVVLEYSDNLKNNIISNLKNMTSNERYEYWDANNYYIMYDNLQNVEKYPSQKLVENAYNSLIFGKGLLLECDKEFVNIINENEQFANIIDSLKITNSKIDSLYTNLDLNNKQALDSLEHIKDRMERDMLKLSNEYKDYTANLNKTWQDIQNNLSNNSVAIEFCLYRNLENARNKYAALVLTCNDSPKFIPLFDAEQLNALTLLKNDYVRSFYEMPESSELIWKPLKQYLEGKENIYFAPSGELYNLAIEYLPHWSGDGYMSDKWNMYRLSSTRELAVPRDKKQIKKASVYGGIKYDTDSVVLKANSLKFKKRSIDINNYAILDSMSMRDILKDGINNLPATKVEAEDVAKALIKMNVETSLRIDTVATEADIKNLSGNRTNLLHVATHGFYWTESQVPDERLSILSIMDNKPRNVEDKALTRSGLLFAGAKNSLQGKKLPDGVDDGILTAQEISQLDLRGMDFVVLSACQTGQGELKGDGVFGLQRGFKKAGAKTLLMSLWQVNDDATQILMTNFYNNIGKGKSKIESLRLAQQAVKNFEREEKIQDTNNSIQINDLPPEQREMLEEQDSIAIRKVHPYTNPYYWASFILLDAIN